jgi:hypothetical protein
MRWVEDPTACGLRLAGHADELARLDHTGWFVDDFQGETVRGVVYRLPSRKGVLRLVAGYADPFNDGPACLDFSETFDDEREAAWRADRIAERMAETEREYQATTSARLEHDELAETIAATRRDALALIREIKSGKEHLCDAPRIVAALRDRLASMLDEIRESRERRAELASDFDHLPAWQDV